LRGGEKRRQRACRPAASGAAAFVPETHLRLAITDVHRTTLARWIKRFNAYGIDGLMHDAKRPGRPTKIPPDKQEAFKELLRHRHRIGRDFWIARALHGYLNQG
jgi:transposase